VHAETTADFKALALDAWKLTRRGRPLWWLGLVSAAQAFLYEAIVMAITAPLLALPQLMVDPNAQPTSETIPLDAWRETALVWITDSIAAHGGAIIGVIITVMLVWIALGVLDVASQTGLITQVSAAENRGTASFSAGMRDGFRVWWRVVGLLAIAALPSLIWMTAMGLVVLFTMTLPLLQGAAPDPGAALAGNAMLSPFSALVSLLGIPLGLTVQLGMRNAVLADADWRESFSAGWKLLRGNVIEVLLVYLLVAAVGMLVGLVAGIALSVVGVVVTVVVVSSALAAGGATATVVATLVASFAVLMLLLVPVTVVLYVWNSAVWTLYWSRKTGRELLGATMEDGRTADAT